MEMHVPKCVKTCLCVQCCSIAVSKLNLSRHVRAASRQVVKGSLKMRRICLFTDQCIPQEAVLYSCSSNVRRRTIYDELIYIKMTKTLRKTLRKIYA